jgi:hypothetical protein
MSPRKTAKKKATRRQSGSRKKASSPKAQKKGDNELLQERDLRGKDPKSVKEAGLLARRYKSLEAIVQFPNLTNVYFSSRAEGQVADISPLAQLPRLRRIALPPRATIKGLQSLADMRSLQTLVIGKGYEVLSEAKPPLLKELEIPYARVKDLLFLKEGFRRLETLIVGDVYPHRTQLNCLEGIEGAVNLSDVRVFHTRIRDLQPLGCLKAIRSLNLYDNPQLKSLAGLETLAHLVELRITGTAVNTIEPLLRSKHLRRVWVSKETPPEDLQDLKKCNPKVRITKE